jgi:hypothetical protein
LDSLLDDTPSVSPRRPTFIAVRCGSELCRARHRRWSSAVRRVWNTGEVVEAVVLSGGFLVGLLVGRWWALLAAVGLGVWIAATVDVEVPAWFLGLGYAAIAGVGIAAGVGARQIMRRDHSAW